MKARLHGAGSEKVFSCQKSALYRTEWRGNTVAIKHIPRPFCVMNSMGMSLESIALQRLQMSPRVVKHFDTIYEEDDVFIIMEWIHGHNIKQYVEGLERPLTEQKVKFILCRIAEFLRTCNHYGYIYGDTKPENIMIQPSGTVKVLDFGCTRNIHTIINYYMGTPIYFSPEMFDKVLLPAYDVWGLGILAYYMACGSHPFINEPYSSHNIESVRNAILDKSVSFHHPVWKEWSEDGKALILQMLEKDPCLRPTIHSIYHNLWHESS